MKVLDRTNVPLPWFRFRRFFNTATRLAFIHAAFATALAATVDFEAIPFALVVTLFAMPSYVLYAILIAGSFVRAHVPERIFLATLLPFSLCLGYGSFYAREGRELAALMLGLYLLPALLALAVELMFKD